MKETGGTRYQPFYSCGTVRLPQDFYRIPKNHRGKEKHWASIQGGRSSPGPPTIFMCPSMTHDPPLGPAYPPVHVEGWHRLSPMFSPAVTAPLLIDPSLKIRTLGPGEQAQPLRALLFLQRTQVQAVYTWWLTTVSLVLGIWCLVLSSRVTRNAWDTHIYM